MNYYNEFDPNASEWIRQLIAMGEIPKGEVDERNIADVTAGDLRGFTQCHFFAGIAGWPEALRRAGVPATRPLWTGSCPCQDYSCAGKGEGVEGDRDLWPEFFRLIRECRPVRVLGEQVSAAIGHGWLDRLSTDLEKENYTVGATVLGAHSAGADHIRQRLYWVADAEFGRREQRDASERAVSEFDENRADGASESFGLVYSECVGRRGRSDGDSTGHGGPLQVEGSSGIGVGGYSESREDHKRGLGDVEQAQSGGGRCDDAADASGANGGVVLTGFAGLQGHAGNEGHGDEPGRIGTVEGGPVAAPGHAGNFWSKAVAIPCRDNCFRRAEPGIFPLVAKLPRGVGYSGDPCLPSYANNTAEARVMRLKGYGNAICVETAKLFIETCEEVLK